MDLRQDTPEHLKTLGNKRPDRITLRKRQGNLNKTEQNHIKKTRRAIAVVFYAKCAYLRFWMKTSQLVNQWSIFNRLRHSPRAAMINIFIKPWSTTIEKEKSTFHRENRDSQHIRLINNLQSHRERRFPSLLQWYSHIRYLEDQVIPLKVNNHMSINWYDTYLHFAQYYTKFIKKCLAVIR